MNEQTKHTPGPWQIDPQCNWKVVSGYDADGDHELIAECGFIENAALIASAPDLLRQRDKLWEALQWVLRDLVTPAGFPDANKGRTARQQATYDAARAILAETEAKV